MGHHPSEAAVAMSGGVDSSMAAYLLKEAGWKVHGIHFRFPCVSLEQEENIDKVTAIARFLGIHLHIIDLREDFSRLVIDPFVRDYLNGLTPNPCVSCNPLIKFSTLYHFIQMNQIPCLATGHYARLSRESSGSGLVLFRGKDRKKDQSYFLHRLDRQVLSKTLFPLGEMTKEEVFARAASIGLPSCENRESQEICFLGSLDYRVFLERKAGQNGRPEGLIVNKAGDIVGEHKGIYCFTVGQRHGLRISSPSPYYVKEIRASENLIVVGRREELYSKRVNAEQFKWMEHPPEKNCIEVLAQIRYRHRAAPGALEILSPSRVRLTFRDPQWAVTPGQSLVCYQGDQVLGGGFITGSEAFDQEKGRQIETEICGSGKSEPRNME